MRSFFTPHFDFVVYQPGDTPGQYDPTNTVLAVNVYQTGRSTYDGWYRAFLQAGFKILVDGLWEKYNFYQDTFPDAIDRCYLIRNFNWFWYNESIYYHYHNMRYWPNRHCDKLALMPMRLLRPHRFNLLNSLRKQKLLDNFLYSANWEEKYLPSNCANDHSHEWQRLIHNEWYDQTYFSFVVETAVDFLPGETVPFVTEKTFKPIACQHPFIVYGHPGTLKFLHDLGFETFENLFDESYDHIEHTKTRQDQLIKNVINFKPQQYSRLTQEKLIHNQNLFYDIDQVTRRVNQEIIEPILEYVHS
jgi:hypothetical protein